MTRNVGSRLATDVLGRIGKGMSLRLQSPFGRWLTFWLLVGVALAALAWGVRSATHAFERYQQLSSALSSAQAGLALRSRSQAAFSATEGSNDFTLRLQPSFDRQTFLSEIQRSCVHAEVRLEGVQIVEPMTSDRQLPRVAVSALLQGPYTSVKDVLADVLGRSNSVTLRQMSIRRNNVDTDVEASVAFAVWSAPPPLAPLGSTTAAETRGR